MSKHKVVCHQWFGGFLKSIVTEFEELAHALNFANGQHTDHAETVKVYNESDEVIHIVKKTPAPATYA